MLRWLRLSNSGNGDREKCGCDQHWIVTDMSLTELTLAFGPIKILKRKRDGKRFVGNPKHDRNMEYVECRCMECPNISEHTID